MTKLPLSITEAAAALRDGTLTSHALTEAVIARADALDGRIGTFLHRTNEAALAAADRADEAFRAGRDLGPLQGIPLGIKDILSTDDAPTTGQSVVLDPKWGKQGDGPVVRRLRDAGAVLVGKTTTMEFAIGFPDPDKPFPVPRNPWNRDTWPGGSSSGTGSGVAAGMFLGGLGTDTAGSVRLPSSYCGISGLKPTFGRVPKSGCIPLSWSFDHIGPMARTARDTALMLDVMAGHDPSDLHCLDVPVPDFTQGLDGNARGLRIGIDRSIHERTEGTDPSAVACFEEAVKGLREAGAEIVEVTIPRYDALANACTVIFLSEAFDYHRNSLRERWSDFGSPTRQMVSVGALYSAADYVQAQRVLRVGRAEIRRLLGRVDLLASLTTGTGAPAVEGLDLARALTLPIFTPVWAGLGFPAMSVPAGFVGDGLPLGLQIIGRPLDEATVLRAGDAFQQQTDWHRRVPSIVEQGP